MSRKRALRAISLSGCALTLATALGFPATSLIAADGTKPNIVFIFIDDLGYGDIGPFGSTTNRTPHLDRMAAEGLALRQFYASNTNCTPSRAALITGTFAHRIGMDGEVLFPGERRGLSQDETTIGGGHEGSRLRDRRFRQVASR